MRTLLTTFIRQMLLVALLWGAALSAWSGTKEQVEEMKDYFSKVDEFLTILDRIESQGYIDLEAEENLDLIRADILKRGEKYAKVAKKYGRYFPEEVFLTIWKDFKRADRKELSLAELHNNMATHLERLTYTDWAPLQMLKDEKQGIKVQALVRKSPHLAYMVAKKNLFDNYYEKLDFKYKVKVLRTAIKAMQSLNEETIDNDYEITAKILSKIFQASGPILQKILQRINDALGSAGLTPFIRDVLKEVLVDINPFDDETATKIVKDRIPRKGAFREADKIKLERRLGAASIGQAHIIDLANKKYVVKFIKPGVSEYADYEKDLLLDVLSGTSEHDILLQNMVGTISDIIKKELDLSEEEKNLKQGIQSYNLGEIKAVGLPAELGHPGVMVMELAEGKDVDRSFRELSAGKNTDNFMDFYDVMKKLYVHFNRNALEGDGFFHGDLHKGNMFYDPKTRKLTLIDFGNAHSLSKEQQKAIRTLLSGLKNEEMDMDKVAEGIRQLLGIKGEPGEDKIFDEIVTDVLNNCVFHETSDEQLFALVDKWRNGRNSTYRKYQSALNSVMGLCLSPLSNSSKLLSDIRGAEDASTKLKIILDFFNNVALNIPQQVNSFIQSKCMLESQLRVINGDLHQKGIKGELITRPEDLFEAILGDHSE